MCFQNIQAPPVSTDPTSVVSVIHGSHWNSGYYTYCYATKPLCFKNSRQFSELPVASSRSWAPCNQFQVTMHSGLSLGKEKGLSMTQKRLHEAHKTPWSPQNAAVLLHNSMRSYFSSLYAFLKWVPAIHGSMVFMWGPKQNPYRYLGGGGGT